MNADVLERNGALGAVEAERTPRGWNAVSVLGEVEPGWLLEFFAAANVGAWDGDDDCVEAVITRDDLHVVVAGAWRALILRLPRQSNVGVALGYARQHMREP